VRWQPRRELTSPLNRPSCDLPLSGVIKIVENSKGPVFESGHLPKLACSPECDQTALEPDIVLGWGGKHSTLKIAWSTMGGISVIKSNSCCDWSFTDHRLTTHTHGIVDQALVLRAVPKCHLNLLWFVCSPESRHDAVNESIAYFKGLAKRHRHEGDLSSFKLFGYDSSQSGILCPCRSSEGIYLLSPGMWCGHFKVQRLRWFIFQFQMRAALPKAKAQTPTQNPEPTPERSGGQEKWITIHYINS